MKKISGAAVCYALSALLLLCFIISTMIDYGRYNRTLNSAPFYLWVAVNILCFAVPAIIILLNGIYIRKKS